MKKVVQVTNIWHCENFDLLAPIDWEGYALRFDDNSSCRIEKSEINNYTFATQDEIETFVRQFGYFYIGDKVAIVKGRKIPIGEIKVIKSSFDYYNNFGKLITKYVVFEDGTKTNIDNIEHINIKRFNNIRFGVLKKGEIPTLIKGGRI